MRADDSALNKAAVQTLFVTARAWDVKTLLRELKATTGGWAGISVEAFVLGLLGFGRGLPAFGLQLVIEGGRVNLCTTPVGEKKRDAWLGSYQPQGPSRVSEPMMEALGMVALKQPVTAPEIERVFGTDRRDALHRLEAMELIERRAGQGAAFIYVTTPRFLERFGADAIARMKEGVNGHLTLDEQKTGRRPSRLHPPGPGNEFCKRIDPGRGRAFKDLKTIPPRTFLGKIRRRVKLIIS